MNIYEQAMMVEKQGESLYREMAQKSPNEGLANILNWLADIEVEHFEIFEKMQRAEEVELPDTNILEKAKNVFQEMKDDKEPLDFDVTQPELYTKAQELEKKMEDFYREKIPEAVTDEEKDILKTIADEEHRHYILLGNLIEFITKPERWVEHAEFSKIGEVY